MDPLRKSDIFSVGEQPGPDGGNPYSELLREANSIRVTWELATVIVSALLGAASIAGLYFELALSSHGSRGAAWVCGGLLIVFSGGFCIALRSRLRKVRASGRAVAPVLRALLIGFAISFASFAVECWGGRLLGIDHGYLTGIVMLTGTIGVVFIGRAMVR